MTAASTAHQKPVMVKLSTRRDVTQNISPLSTSVKSPSVSTLTGSVSTNSTGRMKVLSRPMTSATSMAVPKSLMCTAARM